MIPMRAMRPPPIPPISAPVLIPPEAAAVLVELAEAEDMETEELFDKDGVVVGRAAAKVVGVVFYIENYRLCTNV